MSGAMAGGKPALQFERCTGRSLHYVPGLRASAYLCATNLLLQGFQPLPKRCICNSLTSPVLLLFPMLLQNSMLPAGSADNASSAVTKAYKLRARHKPGPAEGTMQVHLHELALT